MSKTLLSSAAALALISGTAPLFASEPPATSSADSLATAPQFGSWGIDLQGMDKSVKPGDDFYKFVNGRWDATTEIPADRSSWGGFAVLRDLSDTRTRQIIQAECRPRNRGAKGG